MKRYIIGIILAVLIALPVLADGPTGDTYDRTYIIEIACYSLALDVMDESTATANHYERLMLARRVISSPGVIPLKLAKIAEANVWGSAVGWDTATDNQIKTVISNVWTAAAVATYGTPPTPPA